ncbi:MAG: TolC family protein [Gammaproteobacteria bacterium]|nr:TolC family protein [Gammaproteobacteria bacterium]
MRSINASPKKQLLFITLLFAVSLSEAAFALSLQQAEQLALEMDPVIKGHKATSRSYEAESTANGTLPDPKLRLGMFNVPLDSFSTTEDPSTQLRIGIQQEFPRGDTTDLKQQQSKWLAQAALAQASDEKLKLLLNVRDAYLNLYYEIQAGAIVNETRELFTKLVKITEDQYAAGRANQQDVIRADLELSRLDDRAIKIQGNEDEYRAQLAQWVGDLAWQDLDINFPALPDVSSDVDINELLTQHPAVMTETARVEASRTMVEVSRQDYKPGIGAFVEYRKRFGENTDGSDRSDMMAAMVTMDIPLFTENRQDKRVAAREESANAARYSRDDKLRVLKRRLEKDRAIYKRLSERELIYKNKLIGSASSNAEASLNAYQSGVTEFTTLMRAGITKLDVRLENLRIKVDRLRTQARLLYITGDPES